MKKAGGSTSKGATAGLWRSRRVARCSVQGP